MELRDFKDGGWGWYNHAAFEKAAELGATTLAVYMALTKLESSKRGSRGFIASMSEIAESCNLSRRIVIDKLHILQASELVQMQRHSAQCFMYKLLAIDVNVVHMDVNHVHMGVNDVHRMCEPRSQVYSGPKKKKLNIIPAPPGALEIIFNGEEKKDSAPAHSLAASAEAEKIREAEASAKRARIEAMEALENS
jgi:hypothetical protein